MGKNMQDKRWKVGFFTANFVHNFMVKCGELTKIHHISPLALRYCPYTDSNLSTPACQPLILPLHHFSLKSSIFDLNLNQIHSPLCKTYSSNFCTISGEITVFSGVIVWMWWNYVSSPLTLVVNLHKFTALKSSKKMYVYSWANFACVI